ncbi:MAG: branched-chain amino acid ABC transporter permease, partial [Acidimicrobiia bacterium]
HGAFYGVGAYASALVVNYYRGQFFFGIVVGAAVAFAVGIILGLPALRIKGLALALVTLAFAAVFPALLGMIDSVTNAPNNLRITYKIPNPRNPSVMIDALVRFRSPFDPTIIADDQWRYFYVLAIAFACFLLVRNLMSSRVGRAIVAIRDNEIAASTSGINVSGVKLLTFGISSALAGVGGALFALSQDQTQLSPNSFTFGLSLMLLVVVVLGGSGTILGPAIGAVIYGVFNDVLKVRVFPEDWQPLAPLILAVSMIVSVNIAPGGVAGTIRDFFEGRNMKASTREAAISDT